MKNKLITLCIALIVSISLFGQSYRIISLDQNPCPGATNSYRLQTLNVNTNQWEDIYNHPGNWDITNGTVVEGSQYGLNPIVVKWHDGYSKINLKANNADDDEICHLDVYLFTVKNLTPGPILGSNLVPMGEQTITYSIDYMQYPDMNAAIVLYSWIIPVGWKIGGVVSDGSPFTGKGTSIQVTTNATSGGEVKVAAENWMCYENSVSNYTSKLIDRSIPTFNITLANTANTFLHGDQSPVTLQVPNYSWASYSWSTSGGGCYNNLTI